MILKQTIKSLSLVMLMVGILLAESPKALAQESEFSLEDAVSTALANSPQIKRALLSVDDADELVKIAYSEIFPDVSTSAAYSKDIEPSVFFITDPTTGQVNQLQIGSDNSWQAGVSVSQTLFKGETIIGLSSAAIFKAVQQENFRATSQQVITQTRIAYYQILVAKEQLRLQQTQIKRLEENLSENKKRQEAGLVDSYDVLRLEVQLSNQRPLLIEAEYGVEEAYRSLKVIMGVPANYQFIAVGNLNDFDILSKSVSNVVNKKLKEIDQMNAFSFDKENLSALNLERSRGDLRLLDASLDLNGKEITATKSRFLPTVTATYSLNWNSPDPDPISFFPDPIVRSQILGLSVSLPIFQGFKRVADVQRVQIQQKDLEEQKRATNLQAENEVTSASEALNMSFETASARKIALKQAKEGYERSLKRLESGLGSQIEVTEAEVQVRQAEVNYALMVFNYLTAKAQYDLATGNVPFVDIEPTQSN